MDRTGITAFAEAERQIYSLISRRDGVKAREIAAVLPGLTREDVNRELYASPLMRELCYHDADYRWHALIRHGAPHEGLYEFSGWYGTAEELTASSEDEWLSGMYDGCRRIGRNLNDARGLIHSFRDCRSTLLGLFADLSAMAVDFRGWEVAFEFRLNRGRFVRIYADVLVITPDKVFSLEFKMKKAVDPDEVIQAAKYTPYLEIVFGREYDVLPALVLTGANDLFGYAPIGDTGAVLPFCSGDMLFNVFDEYLRFLN